MSLVAYQGPETGVRDRVSYVLQQGKVRFVLTTALYPDSEIADHVRRHGDGVRDIGLWVDDAENAWRETTQRGAKSVRAPFVLGEKQAGTSSPSKSSSTGSVKMASIAIYGDTLHTFVERKGYHRSISARVCGQLKTIPLRAPRACCTWTTWSATSAGMR